MGQHFCSREKLAGQNCWLLVGLAAADRISQWLLLHLMAHGEAHAARLIRSWPISFAAKPTCL